MEIIQEDSEKVHEKYFKGRTIGIVSVWLGLLGLIMTIDYSDISYAFGFSDGDIFPEYPFLSFWILGISYLLSWLSGNSKLHNWPFPLITILIALVAAMIVPVSQAYICSVQLPCYMPPGGGSQFLLIQLY